MTHVIMNAHLTCFKIICPVHTRDVNSHLVNFFFRGVLPTGPSNIHLVSADKTVRVQFASVSQYLGTGTGTLLPVPWDRGVPVYSALLVCMNSSTAVPYLVGIVSRAEQGFNRSRSAPLESSPTSERARIDKSSEKSSQTHARTQILHAVLISMSESVRIHSGMVRYSYVLLVAVPRYYKYGYGYPSIPGNGR